MSYIGAGEGLRPLRTPDRGELSPAPPSPAAAPFSLSHDRGLDGARSDSDEGVWSIPAPRTKGNREHRVPLCRRAMEILEAAQAHKVRSRIEAAYRRSDLFERRRRLMDD